MIRRLSILVFCASCGGAVSQVVTEEPKPVERAVTVPEVNPNPTVIEPQDKSEVIPQETTAQQVKEAISIMKAGNIEAGRDILKTVIASGSGDALTYYNLATAELILGDMEQAEFYAKKAVELSDGKPKPLRLLSDIMIGRRNYSKLETILEDLQEKHPEDAYILNALARLRLMQNKPSDALILATNALKKDEANIDVMKTIAMAYMSLGKLEAAKFVLIRSQEIAKDAEVFNLLAQIMLREGEKKKALFYLQSAIALDPRLADAHNNLGVLYHQVEDFESAVKEFTEAVRIFPRYAIAYLNMGNSLRKMQDFSGARDALRKAINIDPSCADCYLSLGLVELEDKGVEDEPGHYKKAIEYFRRYKEMRSGGKTEVDKYIEEARRMVDYLEKEEKVKEAPKESSEKANIEDTQ